MTKNKESKPNVFIRIIRSRTLAYTIIIALVVMLVSKRSSPVVSPPEFDPCAAKVDLSHNNNNLYTRPFLLNDENVECGNLVVLKQKIESYIDLQKRTGAASHVSVFLRNPSNISWFEINGNEMYMPASILKISFMIPYLLKARVAPEVLQEKIYFGSQNNTLNPQNITSNALVENMHYTVEQLLFYMIVHSDNNASALLAKNMDKKIYKKFFDDLGMPVPDIFNTDYTMNVVQCSKFFRLLFSANYLGREMSEYALTLLSKSKFRDGLLAGVDSNITVAHKFGERTGTGFRELHEGGIVYLDNRPYVLCVMTRGSDYKQLSSVISEISRTVYDYMK
jgi:beta-lactamase class A